MHYNDSNSAKQFFEESYSQTPTDNIHFRLKLIPDLI